MRAATVVVVALLAACALAQLPARCSVPKQWEGRATEYDHGRNLANRFFISYDATNERMRIVEEVHARTPGRQFFEYLLLYRDNIMYTTNLDTKQCKRNPIPEHRSWTPWGIPENATFIGEANIGVYTDSITVTEWEMQSHIHPKNWRWIGTFTDDSFCVPVHQVLATNISASITTNYYDISLGISDPNAFIPPRSC